MADPLVWGLGYGPQPGVGEAACLAGPGGPFERPSSDAPPDFAALLPTGCDDIPATAHSEPVADNYSATAVIEYIDTGIPIDFDDILMLGSPPPGHRGQLAPFGTACGHESLVEASEASANAVPLVGLGDIPAQPSSTSNAQCGKSRIGNIEYC